MMGERHQDETEESAPSGAVEQAGPMTEPPGGTMSSPESALGASTVTPVPSTRTASAWVALITLLVLLALVLLFILQNLQRARVTYFTAHWNAPLAVDLLLAAVLGGLVVAMVGAARIVQLRKVARHHHRARMRAEGAN